MKHIDIANIDLNLLKVFEALFEEESASRAGIRLDMTQSAVSAALGRLRLVYDDTLFMRTGRGLAPTSRALELKPLISEALDRCRQSLTIASPEVTTFEGRSVAIGLSDDFEIALGRKILEKTAQRAPGLRIIFRQTHSQIVSDALANREMDLAITAGGLASRGLGHRVVGHGGYACLVDPFTVKKNVREIRLDEFIAREHILVSSGGVVGLVDEALASAGHRRKVVGATTHFAALPFLLRGTRAVATMPLHAAKAIADLSGLRMLPCPLPLPGYAIELGWRHSSLRDAAVTRVQSLIEECFT